jgi:AAA domain/DeoR-like helix-turn-helix domain
VAAGEARPEGASNCPNCNGDGKHREWSAESFEWTVTDDPCDFCDGDGWWKTKAPKGFTTASLTSRIAAGIEAPQQLVPGLLYEGGRTHLLYGEPKRGKSLLVRHNSLELFRRHQIRTLWLDHEMGIDESGRAWQEMGVTEPDALLEYVEFPEIRDLYGYLDAIAVDVENRGCGHVVIDSFARVLAALGLSEKDNEEVAQFTGPFIKHVKRLGIPHAIIDHTPKGGSTARGAGDKHAFADVAQHVRKVQPFNVRQAGVLEVVNGDWDRAGRLPYKLQFDIGGQGEDGVVELRERDRGELVAPAEQKSKKDVRREALAQIMAGANGNAPRPEELAVRFGVSDKTIRRDLHELDLPALD